MSKLQRFIPELYLIIAVLYYWSLTTIKLNWFAIGLLILLIILLVTKSRMLGLLIGAYFILINLYLVLAMFSELSEFETFNNKAIQLFVFGSLFLGLNILISIMLLLKYGRLDSAQNLYQSNQE